MQEIYLNGHIEREADIEKCVRQGVTTSGPDSLAPPHDHLIYTQKELDLNVDIFFWGGGGSM